MFRRLGIIDSVEDPFQEESSKSKLETIKDTCHYLSKKCSASVGEISEDSILTYLNVAAKCLDMECSEDLVYKWRKDRDTTYYFEYKINEVAASLYGQYEAWENIEDSRLIYHRLNENKKICQSCLTAETVDIATSTLRIENVEKSSHCTNDCQYYCKTCYTTKEKKFCPVHGTASGVLDQSYALIFYGEDFKNENRNFFEQDAFNIRNSLIHRQVHGMREEDIVLKPLYGGENPTAVMEDAVRELKKQIHMVQKRCNNVHRYALFIYYSGHGGRSCNKPGSWRPQKKHTITREEIFESLKDLRNCKDCQNSKGCRQIIWLMDHCYPVDVPENEFIRQTKEEKPYVLVISPYYDESAFRDKRSLFGSALTHYIFNVLHSSIKLSALKLFQNETYSSSYPGFVTAASLEPRIDLPDGDVQDIQIFANKPKEEYFLGYCNTAKVQYTCLSLHEGNDEISWDYFTGDLTLELVERIIKEKLEIKDAYTVLLLTNVPPDGTKYTLAWDQDLRRILEKTKVDQSRSFPAEIFYEVIEKQLTIFLKVKDSTEQVTLPISKKYMDKLKRMTKLEEMEQGIEEGYMELLPNILVYIVHYLYRNHANDEPTPKPTANQSGDSSSTTAPADDSDDSRRQLVFESFIRKIDKRCEQMPLKSDHGRWKHLVNEAANIKIKDKLEDGAFVLRLEEDPAQLEWVDDKFQPNDSLSENETMPGSKQANKA